MKQGGLQVWCLTGSISYYGEPDTVPLVGHLGHPARGADCLGRWRRQRSTRGEHPCAQKGRCWRQGCGGQSIQELRAGEVALVPLATGRWKVLLRRCALTPACWQPSPGAGDGYPSSALRVPARHGELCHLIRHLAVVFLSHSVNVQGAFLRCVLFVIVRKHVKSGVAEAVPVDSCASGLPCGRRIRLC